MIRRTPLRPSRGTVWPPEVKAHIRTHQTGCIGPLAGMLGRCEGGIEDDHIRASHGIGMKSDSIAVNAARLCGIHHRVKTERGKLWRPRLITVVRALYRAASCEACEAEDQAFYGGSFHEECVDPCSALCPARKAVAS